MNAYTAIPPTAQDESDTTAQHRRMLCRLAELGMALAEIAAEDAAAADPAPEPAPTPLPAAARPRARTEHILAFTRLSRIVTQAISLHAALKAGPKHAAEAVRNEDIRRRFLQDALAEIAQLNPHLAISQQDASQALEARLAEPEHDGENFSTLLALVIADLGLPPETQPGPVAGGLFECLEREDPPDPPD